MLVCEDVPHQVLNQSRQMILVFERLETEHDMALKDFSASNGLNFSLFLRQNCCIDFLGV